MDLSFLSKLFDPSGFVPRAQCGAWTPALIRLHNGSDFFIWTAYLAIPVVLGTFAWRRREELPFRQMFWLFGLFIIACGTTHLLDIVLFYHPLYRLSGLVKLVTAAASWGTVAALIPIVPRALAMRSPEMLEREIQERVRVEEQIRVLNLELEQRVSERTSQLEAANRAQEELLQREQQARHEAEEANRAKDEFLAILSHELRTPLTAMVGWISLLRTGQLDEETTQHALESIERNTNAQQQLINDLLDVSRMIRGKIELKARPLDFAELTQEALQSIAPTARAKDIEVEADWQATEHIQGDPERLQQVLWNLLSNAVKFTPSGGRINVRLHSRDGQLELAVQDNGQGIAPEFLPHVFDRFAQADTSNTRRYDGLGIGLSIVRHLVELHGGRVRAESAGAGQGATFIVTLPLLAAPPLAAPLSAAPLLSGQNGQSGTAIAQ